MSAITPWSMLGGRGGCIDAIVVEARSGGGSEWGRGESGPKKFAELAAVSSTTPVDFPIRPLRAAPYDLPVLLRPTPAPRSAHEGIYGLFRHVARGSENENAAICER